MVDESKFSEYEFKILEDGKVQILRCEQQMAVLGFDPTAGITDIGKIRVAKQYVLEHLGEREVETN